MQCHHGMQAVKFFHSEMAEQNNNENKHNV